MTDDYSEQSAGTALQLKPESRRDLGAASRIRRQGDLKTAPLSFGQQRQWFFEQLHPGSAVYNVPRRFRLTGPLDVDALQQALDALVERHEVLRSKIVSGDGLPHQVVTPELRVRIDLVDLAAFSRANCEAEVHRLARLEARRPFDLAEGPLFRARLLRLGAEEQVLLLTLHHIVSDGWSMGVMFRELAALYDGFASGRPVRLPELPIQYGDFARWQHQRLEDGSLDGDMAYWRQQLDGAPPVMALPTDRPRGALQGHEAGSRVGFALAPELVQRLTAVGRSEGATLFMTLLAGCKALLGRLSGQSDLVVGSPIAGRTMPETEGLIGCFTNTLVLRTRWSGDPTFRQLLRRVRDTTLGALAHQELPFEKLVKVLRLERNLGYHPLFQVMMNFRNYAVEQPEIGRLRIEPIDVEHSVSHVDLSFSFRRGPDGISCQIPYDADLYDRATVERVARQYRELLWVVAAEPNTPLSALPPLVAEPDLTERLLQDLADLSDEEVERLLAEEQRGAAPATVSAPVRPAGRFIEFAAADLEGSIIARFERQVQLYPERLAVRERGGQEVTYRELSDRVDRVAAGILSEQGPGPERVALLFERGASVLASVLGVLAAGKVLVPLDVAYPPARNRLLLEHARASLLLTESAHAAEARELAGDHTLLLAESLLSQARHPAARPAVGAGALACLLYTSGSTGVPKGVVYDHRTLLHITMRYTNALLVGPEDRFAQLASLSHMAGITDCLRALLNGAAVLPLDPRQVDPASLLSWLRDEDITVLHVAPSLFRHLTRAMTGAESLPRRLRLVHAGGDSLSLRDVELFRQHFPRGCVLLNNLGCTENSSFCQYLIDHDTVIGNDTVPVGYPVQDTEVLLLGESGMEVPAGSVGEIAVSSRYLSRGYWRDPAGTRRAFSRAAGFRDSRIFRTGDLGRRLVDGRLVHLGRKDFQVQIRGFRVEPEGVERALIESEDVQACAVIGANDPQGETQLVAYVVPTRDEGFDPGALRSLLGSKLPSYMVPLIFLRLDSLPRLPNGKVNRRALPEPGWTATERSGSYARPRSEVEQALAAIWSDVLHRDDIGVDDDFFDLGGNSLLATFVLGRARAAFGIDLSITTLFQHPVLAALAARIEVAKA